MAAGCAEWTGVRLIDVLQAAGVKPSACTPAYGADRSLADPTKDAISRGVPIRKAMDENNLIVFAMNGQPLSNIRWRASAAPRSRLAGLGVVEMA
jgi:DMSO/TMAO reductase YedYZ molybdopterin-dependent catalytic subunit